MAKKKTNCKDCKCASCDEESCKWHNCSKTQPNEACFSENCDYWWNEEDEIEQGYLDGYED